MYPLDAQIEAAVEAGNTANWNAYERIGERSSQIILLGVVAAFGIWLSTYASWFTLRITGLVASDVGSEFVLGDAQELAMTGQQVIAGTYVRNGSEISMTFVDSLFGLIPMPVALLFLAGLMTFGACVTASRLFGVAAAIPGYYAVMAFTGTQDVITGRLIGDTEFASASVTFDSAFKLWVVGGLIVSVASVIVALVAPLAVNRAWNVAEDYEVALTGRMRNRLYFGARFDMIKSKIGKSAGGALSIVAAHSGLASGLNQQQLQQNQLVDHANQMVDQMNQQHQMH